MRISFMPPMVHAPSKRQAPVASRPLFGRVVAGAPEEDEVIPDKQLKFLSKLLTKIEQNPNPDIPDAAKVVRSKIDEVLDEKNAGKKNKK